MGAQVLDHDAKLAPVGVAGMEGTVVWRVRGRVGSTPLAGLCRRLARRLRAGAHGSTRTPGRNWSAAAGAASQHRCRGTLYIETYLEVTRGAMVIVRPIDSLDDIRWRPGSAEKRTPRRQCWPIRQTTTPLVEAAGDGYHVELTIVVDQRLQRNVFDITAQGRSPGRHSGCLPSTCRCPSRADLAVEVLLRRPSTTARTGPCRARPCPCRPR